MDAIEGIAYFGNPIEPQFLIDKSSKFDLKLKRLECHASQRNWLLQQHGIDGYLDSYRKWSTTREKNRAWLMAKHSSSTTDTRTRMTIWCWSS